MAYPEILIDKQTNLPNPDGYFKLTFEQYYDLLHHTHNIADIPGAESSETIQALKQRINEMEEALDALTIKYNELKEKADSIAEQIESEVDIADWDVTKPGIQDADGNTIDPDTGEIIEPATP